MSDSSQWANIKDIGLQFLIKLNWSWQLVHSIVLSWQDGLEEIPNYRRLYVYEDNGCCCVSSLYYEISKFWEWYCHQRSFFILFFKPCFSRREEKPSHLGAAIMRLPGFLKLRHFNWHCYLIPSASLIASTGGSPFLLLSKSVLTFIPSQCHLV